MSPTAVALIPDLEHDVIIVVGKKRYHKTPISQKFYDELLSAACFARRRREARTITSLTDVVRDVLHQWAVVDRVRFWEENHKGKYTPIQPMDFETNRGNNDNVRNRRKNRGRSISVVNRLTKWCCNLPQSKFLALADADADADASTTNGVDASDYDGGGDGDVTYILAMDSTHDTATSLSDVDSCPDEPESKRQRMYRGKSRYDLCPASATPSSRSSRSSNRPCCGACPNCTKAPCDTCHNCWNFDPATAACLQKVRAKKCCGGLLPGSMHASVLMVLPNLDTVPHTAH